MRDTLLRAPIGSQFAMTCHLRWRRILSLSLFHATLAIVRRGRSPCSCELLQITSNDTVALQKHATRMGDYRKMGGMVNGKPAYQHVSGDYHLYYLHNYSGMWGVSDILGDDGLRLENQEAGECPQLLKATWRYANGDLAAFVFDDSLKVTCPDANDPCSTVKCGHNAKCDKKDGTCSCIDDGYTGDPYKR